MNDYSRAEHDELKARVDIAEVLRATGLELRQVGKGLFARCPFHDDDQASFSVTPAEGLWNCFGCEAGGDALSFLQKREGLTFTAAVLRLKELAGVLPAPKTNSKAKRVAQPGQYAPLLGRVAEIYARAFSLSKDAQGYLEQRGLGSKEVWKAFGLGYADGALMETIPSQGEIVDTLKAVGLLTKDGKELFVAMGKGGKSRRLLLGDEAAACLEDYLLNGRPYLAGAASGDLLFLSCGGHKLSRGKLAQLVRETAEGCGLEKTVTPHLLRHACATHMLRRGAGIRQLQVLLGHSELSSTQRYTRIDIGDLHKVVSQYHPRERGFDEV